MNLYGTLAHGLTICSHKSPYIIGVRNHPARGDYGHLFFFFTSIFRAYEKLKNFNGFRKPGYRAKISGNNFP